MGAGWRRVTELARQKLHVADKDFVPTPNTRNELMLKEAGEFAAHLKRCEQDIANLKDATEGIINTTKIVLSAPLPRVYQDAGNGKAQPVVPGNRPPGLIGGEFNAEELGRVSKETGKKLDSEVLAPMQRWLTAYNTVVARMKKLEALRLEVDSRRRTVSALGRKIENQKARLPQTRAKGEAQLESTIKILQHKEGKLTASRQTFKEHESIVYQQLAQLIRDAVWLKSYIVAVMRLEQEAFTAAYGAVGPIQNAAMASIAPESAALTNSANDSIGLPTKPESLPMNKDAYATYNSSPQRDPYTLEAPPAPTHRYAIPASNFDRYNSQGYAQGQQYNYAQYAT